MNRSCFLLRDIAASQAQRTPDSLAYLFLRDGEIEQGRLTFGEVDAKARAAAGWLQKRAAPGERAVLAYPAGLEFIITFLACAYARLIPVPVALPGRTKSRDAASRRLMAVVADCSPSLLLSTGSARENLPTPAGCWQFPDEAGELDPADYQTENREDSPDDIAFLQYTSGSTEKPRGVAVTHRALYAQLEFHKRQARQKSSEILAGWLPHHHDFGLVGFHLSALYIGSFEVFMSPAAFILKPSRWLEVISRYRVTYSGGPSFAYELCANSQSAQGNSGLDLSSWVIASVGGESVSAATLRKFSAAFQGAGFRPESFLPAYGLAESVLCATARPGLKVQAFNRLELQHKRVVPANGDSCNRVELVSHGQPIDGLHLRIVDPESKESLPPDRVGEIWLQGDSMPPGYWQDEARTLSLFRATIAGENKEEHYLRTGDCGFVYDGNLYVTGRLKDLIIARGANHSADDLEETIQAADASLRPGCGAVFQHSDGAEPSLIVVQEVRRGIANQPQIFSSIVRAVAEHHGLRVNSIVLIKANTIPRTTSGKVRRHECKELFLAGKLQAVSRWDDSAAASDEAATGDEFEACLLSHLRALLPHARIGVNDNIFSHGCDSLTAHRYLARIRDSFQVSLPVQTLFDAPTVSALSGHVRTMIRSRVHDEKALHESSPRPPSGTAGDPFNRLEELGSAILHELRLLRESVERSGGRPVSAKLSDDSSQNDLGTQEASAVRELNSAQREISLLEELEPATSSAFNRISVVELRRPLDKETAARILRQISKRHDALRSLVDDRTQRVLPYVEPAIQFVSLPGANEIPVWLREERRRKFDAGRPPLWRVHVLATERDSSSFLVITAHALIVDNWSLGVIGREFGQLWSSLSAGISCVLPPAGALGELCDLKREQRRRPQFAAHKQYWFERIGPRPFALEFPSDEPRRSEPNFEAACHSVVCDGELRTALVKKAGEKSSTLFQTLLSAYFVLLHRYTGQERLTIGIESSARDGLSGKGSANAESVVGCCSELVPVVIDFSDPCTVGDVVKAVRDETISALEHQSYTLSMLAEDLRIPFDPKEPVWIPATISFCSPPQSDAGLPRFDLAEASVTQSPFALALEIRDLGTAIRLEFTYQEVILGTAIERLARWYLRILKGIASETPVKLFELQILDDEERRRMLAWGTGEAEGTGSNSTFQSQFEQQAAVSGAAVAAVAGKNRITYDELNRDANKLAWQLTELRELKRGAPVGILCFRGRDYLTAIAGAIKAGRVCLPLDPAEPLEQLRQKLKRAAAGILCFSERFREIANALGSGVENGRILCLPEAITSGSGRTDNPPIGATPDSDAFLFDPADGRSGFASITHRGMLNQLHAKIGALEMSANDVVAQSATQSHQNAIWQFLAPLLAGAAVCVLDEETSQDAQQLLTAIAENGITILQARSYIARDLLEIAAGGGDRILRGSLKTLRWLVSTGEALPADLCRRWISSLPRTRILNGYGSAECCGTITQYPVVWPPQPEATRVPIGSPIPGVRISILDRHHQPVPAGTPGELFVEECCVANGNGDALSGPDGSRLQATGALARFRADGALEYLGELRRLVLLGDRRIEPGEVECALRRSPAVLDAAVTVKKTGKGEPVLAAYVALRKSPPTSAGILRALVRNLLPQSLVPSIVVSVDRFPRTRGGDIDWDALPEAGLEPRLDRPAPPSTPIEEEIARIWREVLNVRTVGIHDDLFELGGTSLSATRIGAQIEAVFSFRMPVSAIFRTPTVAGVAGYVEKQLKFSSSARWKTVSQTTE